MSLHYAYFSLYPSIAYCILGPEEQEAEEDFQQDPPVQEPETEPEVANCTALDQGKHRCILPF